MPFSPYTENVILPCITVCLLFEQRLQGLKLILALGFTWHGLWQTEIHKKHLHSRFGASRHNDNVASMQIIHQDLAAMHLPQGLLSIWQYLYIPCMCQSDVRACDSCCTYVFSRNCSRIINNCPLNRWVCWEACVPCLMLSTHTVLVPDASCIWQA